MVESVDTRDLKSLGVRAVRVQVPLRVPWGKSRIIKAISSVVKPPKGGFFVPEIWLREAFTISSQEYCHPTTVADEILLLYLIA